MSSKLLLTPGPTNIPEEYLEILGNDIIHHRTPEFRRIMKENNENLKKVFKTTQNDVAVLTSSGTGSMETAIVNFFSKGDKVLAVNTGYFGDRFRKIAEIYGLNVINLQYEFGESYKLEDVKKVISENPDLKGILATHSETSVGILNDIKSLGDLTKNTEILLVVDTISGLVVNEFNFDEWHVDVAIAGSQKAFLIPPGLAFVAISDKAKKAMETSDLPKYYFDLKQYIKYFEEGREAFGRKYGLSYLDVQREGYATPIVKSLCEHKKMVQYGEQLRVETQYMLTSVAKLVFRYFLYNEADELVCTGETVQVFTSLADNSLALYPPPFYEKWKNKMKELF